MTLESDTNFSFIYYDARSLGLSQNGNFNPTHRSRLTQFADRPSILGLHFCFKITIYDDANFGGASRELTESCRDLTKIGFNDRISSIKVVGSAWVGYEHGNYGGRQYILEERNFPDPNSWGGSNDQLSSLKKLDINIGDETKIVVYADGNFKGNSKPFESEVKDLSYYSFNDVISSVEVKSGTWVLYEHSNYKGRMYVLTKGSYANPSDWGPNDTISSLRPVKEPFSPTEVLSMEFDIAAGHLNATPRALVDFTQRNDTSADQKATWGTSHTETSIKTYEWHWQNVLDISANYTFETGVPVIFESKLSISAKDTFTIGASGSEKNTKHDEWHFELPTTVKAHTSLRVQCLLQDGNIDVPFHAVMKKGDKQWTETGTYHGTQSYNIHVDYKETPI
ncbi:epidermal differentiation-specific protein-like [Patiria miniata]|uniref:Beta/gamma crystallin 'Greek key' domain-containing protein n=1 Tax=Patiria miniata TaxID=46514 RepID=A0A913ZIG4_PATMI|nr:epidermal differentiation-specific protein-like [Patiria miniata]